MKGKRGFSLIEIVVVLMIFAILAALAWPALTNYYRDSNEEIYLAEGDKVLTAAQVEAKKLCSEVNGATKLDDIALKDSDGKILKRTALKGELVSIYPNDTRDDVGFFCYKVEDGSCYVIYENGKLYISKDEVYYMDNIADRVRRGFLILFGDMWEEYFSKSGKVVMESNGPNFGIKYEAKLKEMGIDISLCSFRIYVNDHGKNGDGSDATFTLTVSSKRITNEMAETKEEFQITRYIFTGGIKEGNYSKYTGTAKAVLKSENDTSGIRHNYAVIEANANSLKPVK